MFVRYFFFPRLRSGFLAKSHLKKAWQSERRRLSRVSTTSCKFNCPSAWIFTNIKLRKYRRRPLLSRAGRVGRAERVDGHKLAETSFKKNVNPKSKSSGFGLQYTACGKFDLAARRKKNDTVIFSLSANSAFVAGYAQPWAGRFTLYSCFESL